MKELKLEDFRATLSAIAEKNEWDLPEDFSDDEDFSQANINQDLGLDSLDLVELEMELMTKLDVSLPFDFDEYRGETVADYVDAFNKYATCVVAFNKYAT